MSWSFCEAKNVKKTRKPHRCEFCDRLIPIGSQNIYNWSGLYDGDFVNSYSCNWCEDHINNLVDDEEILDFVDCLTEDIFRTELEQFDERVYFESDGDYFVFKTYDADKELLRVKCPVCREEKENN